MNRPTALAAALAALLMSLPAVDAQAQATSTSRGQRPVVEGSEDDEAKSKAADEAPSFANTRRPEPDKPKANAKLSKLYDLLEKGKHADVMSRADEILADPKSTPLERGHAAYVAGYAALESDGDSYAKAIEYLDQAIASDQLSNNAHFTVMFQVAQMQLAEEKYADSLKTIDRYLAESGAADAKGYAMRGNALYRLERFPEAIVALKQATDAAGGKPEKAVTDMLVASYFETDQFAEAAKLAEATAAAKPDDKRAQLDLATIYVNADQLDKAAAVFERLRAAGKLTDSQDYEQGYRILSQMEGRERDTAAFINEGLSKGVLKPSASVYSVLGQSHYYAEDMPAAIAAWEKGAPLAKDGELYLNLSKANAGIDQYAAARTAAQNALSKGVKRPGDAWTVIANSERGLGNKAAELAAWREAAKDPSTRAQAERMIKALSGK
jgi:hypothetical protein